MTPWMTVTNMAGDLVDAYAAQQADKAAAAQLIERAKEASERGFLQRAERLVERGTQLLRQIEQRSNHMNALVIAAKRVH